MNTAETAAIADVSSHRPDDVVEIARALAPRFADRAAAVDEGDTFVAENLALLKEAGLLEAGVPVELGGRGADVATLCDMLRVLAGACGSTALAFAMHTHQVAIPAWRWRHQGVAAVEPLLRRVAAERLMLLSSGGSDWIGGSGRAVKVENGWRIDARKVFTSGSPAGDLLMTGAVAEGEDGRGTVIHFAAPMKSPAVRVEDTWKAHGMRGTGSNDVVIDGLFVPDTAVSVTREAGRWHPLFHVIATVALPLIYAVYLGVAESARDLAVDLARRKPVGEDALQLAGRMDTTLRATRLAHRHMVEVAGRGVASAESVNEVMIGRTLVGADAIRTVELAMELAGGAAFYRRNGLERRMRDVQGARFHPLQAGPQARFAGAVALGQPTAEIF
ncbi:acyl-CoA dehydrogenase family protein [Chthonobacter rhizosphaerae]|uniref:acyl-CoA dehydrogenase family protein n=1 Tax=Chthonobacter rhizosphaerae TaxID=2735553 RepID=UPI0015EEC1D2|nr:acyl-CoA dehydrogenase family protein [Chthonobacter rhizosphaerae]